MTVELLLISFWIAAYLTRNTVQDVVYKRRGEDPPYLVRQRERAARREARGPVTERGAAGRFFAALWEDAWEDAHDKHSKARARKRQEQEEQQALRDKIDALMDEAVEENRRRDAEKADRDAQRREAWQAIPDHCEACGKNVGKDNLTIAATDGDLQWVCADCAKPEAAEPTAPAQPAPETAPAAAPAPKTTPDPNRTSDAKTGEEDTSSDTTGPGAPGDPNPNDDGATVTQIDAWRPIGASDSTTTPEEILSVSGETTNLSAALAYTSGMADSHDQAVTSNETSISTMTAGGVTGEPISLLTQAQELEGQLADIYRQANAALAQQLQVQEAYHANPDAGDREFVSQD